jgi:hypothetical protein
MSFSIGKSLKEEWKQYREIEDIKKKEDREWN